MQTNTEAPTRSSTTVPPSPTGNRGRTLRRLRWVALGATATLVLAAAGGYLWLRATSQVKTQGVPCADAALTVAPGVTTPEAQLRDGICTTLDGLVSAWNDADATRYGDGFTEDATYVAFTGTVYQGRADIVAGHEALFTGLLEGTRLTAAYLDVRVTSETTAVVLARGDTFEDDAPTEPSKVQTFTLVRQPDGPWRVATFHNTQRQPAMERFQFLLNPGSVPANER